MKHLKRYIFLSALLALLIGCFAFTVSATGYDYGAMEEPSAGDYPLIDPGVSEGPSASDGGVAGTEPAEPPPDVYVPVDPGPSDLYALSIRVIGGFDHSYSFYKTDVSTWSDIWDAPSEYGAYFKINQGYLMYVFDGVQYYIFDHEDNHLIKPSDALASGYYDLGICSAGEHSFGSYVTMKQPTCTEGGYSLGVCGYCSSLDRKELGALGHKYNIVGTCTRCGYNFFFGGSSDSNQGGSSGSAGDGSGSAGDSSGADTNEGGESGSDPLSDLGKWLGELGGKIKNFFGSSSGSEKKPWYEDLLDKIKGDGSSSGNSFADAVGSLVSLLSLGLVCLVVVVLWPILKPIMEFIGDGIKAAIKAVSSGVKSLSKKVKNKKKS